MKNNFIEKNLSPDFCADLIQSIRNLINSSIDFTLINIPGLGATTIFKYLITQDFANFIYLNLYNLPVKNKEELLKLLLKELGGNPIGLNQDEIIDKCEEKLKQLSTDKKKTVILLTHFYQLEEEIDRELFAILDRLREVNLQNIILVFQAHKPLFESVSEDVGINHLNILRKIIYLKPFSKKDLQQIITTIPFELSLPKSFIQKALLLCGGHILLLKLLLKSERLDNPISDKYITAELKEICQSLSYVNRKTIEKIALKKSIAKVSQFLLDTGFVQKTSQGYQLFTPLLEEYLILRKPLRFAGNEAKLFKLLKQNLGKVVAKDIIFNVVWGENNDASDWALNSIIYRLRKNSVFIAQGYLIESHKKLGYSLNKN